MAEEVPTSSLVIAAAAASIAAAVFGSIAFWVYASLEIGDFRIPTITDLSDTVTIAVAFGVVGILASIVFGVPALVLLRMHSRLDIGSVATAGAIVGLSVALLFKATNIFLGWSVLSLGVTIGGVCGWAAWLALGADVVRPNTSLERTREG